MGDVVHDPDCIFCRIIEKKIPSTVVSEDEHYTAIRDVNPQAPTHILVIPKNHVANVTEVEDAGALGKLFQSATKVARAENLSSFRLVVNTGPESGQTVYHLHIHVLGGRAMHWPPG